MGSEQNTQDTSNSMNQYNKKVIQQHRYFEISMINTRLLYILDKLRRSPKKHVQWTDVLIYVCLFLCQCC